MGINAQNHSISLHRYNYKIADLNKIIDEVESFSGKKKDGKISQEELRAYRHHEEQQSNKKYHAEVEQYMKDHPEYAAEIAAYEKAIASQANSTEPQLYIEPPFVMPPQPYETGTLDSLLEAFDDLEDNKTGKRDGILSVEDLWKERELQLVGKGIKVIPELPPSPPYSDYGGPSQVTTSDSNKGPR